MSWTYSQSTGVLKHNGRIIYSNAYSGYGAAKNDPDMEALHNAGPIPRGRYSIEYAINSRRTGRHVLPLTPLGHHAHGRGDFQIHGDSIQHPGSASHGCIILPGEVRNTISSSNDWILEVIR